MAVYWASRNPLPFATDRESLSAAYAEVRDLKAAALGLSMAQGQADVFGAIEMLGALQYHYQNFMRIREKMISGAIELEAPDQRFECAAYISRVGQFHYFADSNFSKSLMGESTLDQIPSIERLLPFRHKYAAHRARDKPLRGTSEKNDISADLALGALGGQTSMERERGTFELLSQMQGVDRSEYMRLILEKSYTVFDLFTSNKTVTFNLEVDHPDIVAESSKFLRSLIEKSRRMPRD